VNSLMQHVQKIFKATSRQKKKRKSL